MPCRIVPAEITAARRSLSNSHLLSHARRSTDTIPLGSYLLRYGRFQQIDRVTKRCLSPFHSTRVQTEDKLSHDVKNLGVLRAFPDKISPKRKISPERKPYDSILVNELEAAARSEPDVRKVHRLLKIILNSGNKKPTAKHYECLILARAEAQYGSAEAVREIFREMQSNGIEIDCSHLHAALKVLAVHPDYTLRSDVMGRLREKSITLSYEGLQEHITALIRERQFELAIDAIEHARSSGWKVEAWIEKMLVYCLCEVEEFEAALETLGSLPETDLPDSLSVWHHLLGSASAAHNHEVTSRIWTRLVEKDYFKPPTGMCHSILATAARAADVRLATEVLNILSGRGEPITLHEYEYLLDAYTSSGDGQGALRLLTSLSQSSIEVEDSSTRSLTTLLQTNATFGPDQAWHFLHTLTVDSVKNGARGAPIAAINAIIEAHVARRDSHAAFHALQHMAEISSAKPNLRTFNLLLQDAFNSQTLRWVTHCYALMQTASVTPDSTSYELSMLTAAAVGAYRPALSFLSELKETEGTVSRDAFEACRDLVDGVEDVWALRLGEQVESWYRRGSERGKGGK